MRNLKFLIGAFGGVLGGYVLSNRKLRKRLTEAKDANEAAKILGREIQQSGKQVAKEVQDWLKKPEVQEKFDEWRKYLAKEGAKLRRQAGREISKAAKVAKKRAGTTYLKAKKTVTRA